MPKKMNHIMTVGADGNITTLWTEEIPLEALGGLEIVRASTIEFNARAQLWEVRLSNRGTRVQFAHPSRSRCVEWEIDLLSKTPIAEGGVL